MLEKKRVNGTQINFNFVLTEQCNWRCKYCFFTDIQDQRSANFDIVKMHLEYIKDFMIEGYMDVQGGDIGLVDIGLLEYFFETMGRKMYVSTNGVFLNKKMHLNEKIKPFIKMIWKIIYVATNKFSIELQLIINFNGTFNCYV